MKSVTLDNTMETLSLPLVGGVSQEVAVSGSTVEKVTVGIHDVLSLIHISAAFHIN